MFRVCLIFAVLANAEGSRVYEDANMELGAETCLLQKKHFMKSMDSKVVGGATSCPTFKSLAEVIEHRSQLESTVDYTWVTAENLNDPTISGPYHFGLPIDMPDDINTPMADKPTEGDILALMGHVLAGPTGATPVKYLEIGSSVGKTFFLVTGALPPNAESTTLTFENMNPTLLSNFKKIGDAEVVQHDSWSEEDYTLAKSLFPGAVTHCATPSLTWGSGSDEGAMVEGFLPFTTKTVDFTTASCGEKKLTYIHGNALDEHAWDNLNHLAGGKKFNLILSDACHAVEAVKFECEIIVQKQLIDFTQPFFYSFDDGLMNTHCLDVFNKAAGTDLTSATVVVNGWMGGTEGGHHFGIITNMDITDLQSDLQSHGLQLTIGAPAQ